MKIVLFVSFFFWSAPGILTITATILIFFWCHPISTKFLVDDISETDAPILDPRKLFKSAENSMVFELSVQFKILKILYLFRKKKNSFFLFRMIFFTFCFWNSIIRKLRAAKVTQEMEMDFQSFLDNLISNFVSSLKKIKHF